MHKRIEEVPDNEKPTWMQAMLVAADELELHEGRHYAERVRHFISMFAVELLPYVGGPLDGMRRDDVRQDSIWRVRKTRHWLGTRFELFHVARGHWLVYHLGPQRVFAGEAESERKCSSVALDYKLTSSFS